MQMEWVRERSREVDLNGLIRWKVIDRAIRHYGSRVDCTAKNLEEHRNGWWDKRDIVDRIVPSDRILNSKRWSLGLVT